MESFPFDLSLWYDTYLPEAYRYYDMQTPQERAARQLLQFGAQYVSEGSIWFPDIYAQNGLQEHLASLLAYAMMPDPPFEWRLG